MSSIPNMNEDLTQLKADIAEFEKFKNELDRTQLTFPLDKKSLDVMHQDLMIPTSKVNYPFVLNVVPDIFSVQISVNGKQYLLSGASI